MARVSFVLHPVPPFRLDLTAWAIRRRPHNTIDLFENGIYRRAITIQGSPVALAVSQTYYGRNPQVTVEASGSKLTGDDRAAIEAAVVRILGLDVDLRSFYSIARRDRALSALATRLRGMKPVRFPTVFEAFTNAVSCQLVSLTAGLHVVNRIAAAFGDRVEMAGVSMHCFPGAKRLVTADVEHLREMGLSRNKARYLIGIAARCADSQDQLLASIDRMDDPSAIDALCELAGVGRWTAEYVLLRGFGRFNIFPGDDVGGRNALQRWLGIKSELGYDAVLAATEPYKPWAGFIYYHLLVNALMDRGIV